MERVMQVSGRVVILAVVGLALAMSGGAWWYQYQASRRTATFWGPQGATLLVQSDRVALVELGEPIGKEHAGEEIAGRVAAATHDLSEKPGLVHLRHAFTQDANLEWEGRRTAPVEESGPWAYALIFGAGDEQLVVLLSREMDVLGKLVTSPGGEPTVDVLPSPRLAGPVRQYLTHVGTLDGDSPQR